MQGKKILDIVTSIVSALIYFFAQPSFCLLPQSNHAYGSTKKDFSFFEDDAKHQVGHQEREQDVQCLTANVQQQRLALADPPVKLAKATQSG